MLLSCPVNGYMDPGFRIDFFRFPDLGSWIPNGYFEELCDNFCKCCLIFFFNIQKIKSILWNMWLQKKEWATYFFPPLSFVAIFRSGFGMGKSQDPGSTIRIKHPGSATLLYICNYFVVLGMGCIRPTRRGQRPGTDALNTRETSATPPLMCTSRPRPSLRLRAATPTCLASSRSLPG